ncbi:MAG: hypothetical protein QOE54_2781 [Streptosporangiaceae bacterium]|jgi:hypothetical protein|nr:hypothetical protein [Streptosporangiaceae bacterium]MDX6430415.1 hypothetical protein [Streptosporangiaceae bacterium]
MGYISGFVMADQTTRTRALESLIGTTPLR